MRATTIKSVWRTCTRLGGLLILLWPQIALSENWIVVDHGKRLTFSVLTEVPNGDEMMGLEGSFPDWTAAIDIDFDDLTGSSIEIAVDLPSVDLSRASLKTDLIGKQWFDAKRHPVAMFRSDRIFATKDGYAAHGTLSLKGIEATLVLVFNLTPSGELVQVQGTGHLDRFDWNIGDATPSSVVQSQVTIHFDFKAAN
ncbi:MAG: YceI family protein [Pelagibaca sp.]